MNNSKVIYKSGKYRIVQIQCLYYSLEDLKGDCYSPEVNTSLSPEVLLNQERDFEALVNDNGVYGFALEVWNKEVGQGWETVDSCFGFVGPYEESSPDFNHYIVDELKRQIGGAK